MYKIIGADQKEYGPITADQLRQWISEGRVNGQTKVQPEGGGTWRYVSELPEFAGLVPRPAAPIITGAPPVSLTPVSPQGSAMALWSMVVGIFSLLCCQIAGPVSIILGAIALSNIKKNPYQTGSGFAITGIILGVLSVLVVIIVLIFYLPQFGTMFQEMQNNLPH